MAESPICNTSRETRTSSLQADKAARQAAEVALADDALRAENDNDDGLGARRRDMVLLEGQKRCNSVGKS